MARADSAIKSPRINLRLDRIVLLSSPTLPIDVAPLCKPSAPQVVSEARHQHAQDHLLCVTGILLSYEALVKTTCVQ
jgi:hypothetical protein